MIEFDFLGMRMGNSTLMSIPADSKPVAAMATFDLDGILIWRTAKFAQRFASLEVPAEIGVAYQDILAALARAEPSVLLSSGYKGTDPKDWAKWRFNRIQDHGSVLDLILGDGSRWRVSEVRMPLVHSPTTNHEEYTKPSFRDGIFVCASDVSDLERDIRGRETALGVLRLSLGGSDWRTSLDSVAAQLASTFQISQMILLRIEGDPDAGPRAPISRIATGYQWISEPQVQSDDKLDSLRWSDIETLVLPKPLRDWFSSLMQEGTLKVTDSKLLSWADLLWPLPEQGRGYSVPLFVDERPWGALLVLSAGKFNAVDQLQHAVETLALIFSTVIQFVFNQDRIVSSQSDAEGADRARNKFLAQISHEIRTPLQGLIGALELAQAQVPDVEGDDSIKGQTVKEQFVKVLDLIEVADRSSHDLLNVVNEILDYSRIQSDHFTLSPTWSNPRQLLDSVCELFSAAAQDKGLDLGIAYGDLPLGDWWLDQQRVRQILVNLLENAIKYTKLGGVLMSVQLGRLEPGDPGEAVPIEFTISDTGPGISEDAKHTLFDAFARSETETARRAPGTGLGLEICARLGAAMGGHVSVESQKGQGSTFSLRLAPRMRPSLAPSRLHEALVGRRCLIIAPRGELRRGLVRTLNGLSAVVSVYDVVSTHLLVDLEDSGSLEMAEYIFVATQDVKPILQAQDKIKGKIITLPIGGCAKLPNTIMQTRAPLSWRNLESVICGIETEARNGGSGPLFSHSVHVLIVEDSKTNQMTISGMLKTLGVQSNCANNGKEAVEALKKGKFDLVLMDIQMPVMDGLEACVACRKLGGKVADIPIVALSGSVLEDVRQACRLAGMDGFLSKPTRANDLRDTLLYWLDPERRNAARGLTPDVTIKSVETPVTNLNVAAKPISRLDLSVLNQRRDELGDEGLKMVVNVFVCETGDRTQAIRAALRSDDLKTICGHAHTIKSAAKSFGLGALGSIAEQTENACNRGDLASVQSLATELIDLVPAEMQSISIEVMK